MNNSFTGFQNIPLAERLRPKTINDVIGQSHLLGPGKPLRVAYESGQLHSMILWGPPGVGKTTLAQILAKTVGANFLQLSAVEAGVKEIREAIEKAQLHLAHKPDSSNCLFIDEIHRLNKGQQDVLLPHVEKGLFVLTGATTSNPSFELNSALLSRAQVHVLHPLSNDDLLQLLERAQTVALKGLTFDDDAVRALTGLADGDGRRLLGLLEQAEKAARITKTTHITQAFLGDVLSESVRRFDKGGDAFYEQISAMQKSIRGSDPDAALYWLVRMLDGGADPRYIARRLVVIAWEDIGLSDPRAADVALNAAATFERLGIPEGLPALGQAAIYLACAAKSNASYKAFYEALAFVKADGSREVPIHLRNAPTQLMKDLGYKAEYRYAHDEPHAYAAGENYFPEGMREQRWYQPTPRGLEARISEKLTWLRSLDEAAGKKGT
jgi:putative ATPase